MTESITFSKHAKERIERRGITEFQVHTVISDPDKIIKESECKNIYQKKITDDNQVMLFRVFLNTCKTPRMIITAYKTSKISKYED
jgi:hypothetical protein